ncbi:TolC family protein [bacterium]|nr:TolC family protein [bacterium]
MMKNKLLLITLIFVIIPIISFSQAQKITLEKAISIALKENLDLKEMSKRLSSSKNEEKAAISEGFLPKADLVQSYSRIDNNSYKRANEALDFIEQSTPPGMDINIEPFAFKETYSTSIKVTQPIFNGTAIGAYNAMKAQRKGAEATYDEIKLEIIFAVKTLYYNILRSINAVTIFEQKVEATKGHLKRIERMMEVGVASRSDLVRWKLQLAKDEGDLTSAKIGVLNLKKQFNNLLDLPLETEYEFVEENIEQIVKNMKDRIAPEIEEPTNDHPLLLQKKFSIDASNASKFMALSGFMPSVNFSFNYGWREDDDWQPDDYKKWKLGLMFNIHLFHSGRNYFKLKSANDMLELSKIDYEKTLEKIKLDNYIANLKLEEEYAQIEISERRVDDAEENMKVISNKYEVGVASNLDFIDASVELTYAKLSKVNALYSFLINLAEKEKVQGKLVD